MFDISMTEVIPEGMVGVAATEHFDVSEFEASISAIREGRWAVEPGRYVRLTVGGEVMMSDTPMEKMTNREVVQRAHGRVLIAGLGIGMVLKPILNKPDVAEVVVVERSSDVIALVGPRMAHPKLKIVQGDIMEWRPEKQDRFNTIYFDIWPTICLDNLKVMTKLHRAFASRLDRSDPQAWMDSWMRDHLKYMRRREWSQGKNWF